MEKRVSVFLFCEKRRFMNEQTKVITQETPEKEEFIMLPTVDFCFKELMQSAKVRQGMIAALLGVEPEKIERTELLPTILHTEFVGNPCSGVGKIAERRTG